MKSHVLHTVWCNISGEAAGGIWNWSLLWIRLMARGTYVVEVLFLRFHEAPEQRSVNKISKARELTTLQPNSQYSLRSYPDVSSVSGKKKQRNQTQRSSWAFCLLIQRTQTSVQQVSDRSPQEILVLAIIYATDSGAMRPIAPGILLHYQKALFDKLVRLTPVQFTDLARPAAM